MVKTTSGVVRTAERSDIDLLAEIELAAGRLFPASRIPDPDHTHPVPLLEQALQAGLLFVIDVAGEVVGFASCSRCANRIHLDEISVHPSHGRKGYGRMLVARVIDVARQQGLAGVGLTTFADIPWNGPFYASMGFREVPEAELDNALMAALTEERRLGMTHRIGMIHLFDDQTVEA